MTVDRLDALVVDGTGVEYMGDQCVVRHHDVGWVVMPTGRVWAADPLTAPRYRTESMVERIEPGRYRAVAIVIDGLSSGAEPGGLCLLVRDEPIAAWEPARWVGCVDDGNGYPVDSGTGCFADIDAGFELATSQDGAVADQIELDLYDAMWALIDPGIASGAWLS